MPWLPLAFILATMSLLAGHGGGRLVMRALQWASFGTMATFMLLLAWPSPARWFALPAILFIAALNAVQWPKHEARLMRFCRSRWFWPGVLLWTLASAFVCLAPLLDRPQ